MQNLRREIAGLANEIDYSHPGFFLILIISLSVYRQTSFNLYQFSFLSSRSVVDQRKTKAN